MISSRVPDIQPAIVGCPGDALGIDARGEMGHPRRIQIQPEAEKRIPLTRARQLAGDGQVDREDQHARGIVLEHFTAQHHDLGALRHDAQRRPEGGMHRLRSHSSTPQRVGAREPKRNTPSWGA